MEYSCRKGVFSKIWGRCKSDKKKGCFPIFVGPGPERERFVIKTEQVNHPLFKILLQEAEFEYGYAHSNGPLMLPCDVDHFVAVLIQIMDGCDEQEKACNSSFHFHTPPRSVIALS